MPELLEIELFFSEMYQICGADFNNIRVFCELHGLTNSEILEAIQVVGQISVGVENASNTVRT